MTTLEIDRFDYADASAFQAAWIPQNDESPPPEPATGPGGEPIGRFGAPLGAVTAWRVAWDREGAVDLSGADRILLRMRADDPGAAMCVLYAQSGEGWYRFSPVGLDREWMTAVLPLRSAGREGRPGGWEGVGRLRLSFHPISRRDTTVEVAWIRAARGLRPEDIGRISRFSSYTEARDHILASIRAENRAGVVQRLERVDALRAEILAGGLATEDSSVAVKVQTCRDLMAQAYAMVQQPRAGELRGFWCHYGSGPVMDGKRASWDKAIPMLADGGLNAIFPNMLFSGVAYYPSKVVPTHPIVAEEGDQLAACIKACRQYGIQLHLWKVC